MSTEAEMAAAIEIATAPDVLSVWEQFRIEVEALEEDVAKNTGKGNMTAGVRVRKTVRRLRKLGADLIKATEAADKVRKEQRKAAKAAKKAAASTSVE